MVKNKTYKIGHCMDCGKPDPRLQHYRVIGLCDECSENQTRKLFEFFGDTKGLENALKIQREATEKYKKFWQV